MDKEQRIAGCKRRNLAHRKILNCQHIDIEIRTAIAVIIDLLSHKSNYQLAWPSAQFLATKLGRSRRSALWYIKIIKQLGIFSWKKLSPSDAVAYVQEEYGFIIKLDRCTHQAPNLFEINEDHSLWDKSNRMSDDLGREMDAIVRAVKKKRNDKTTSRLSVDPGKHPGNSVAKGFDSVASFTTSSVANDTQVLRFISTADASQINVNAFASLLFDFESKKELPSGNPDRYAVKTPETSSYCLDPAIAVYHLPTQPPYTPAPEEFDSEETNSLSPADSGNQIRKRIRSPLIESFLSRLDSSIQGFEPEERDYSSAHEAERKDSSESGVSRLKKESRLRSQRRYQRKPQGHFRISLAPSAQKIKERAPVGSLATEEKEFIPLDPGIGIRLTQEVIATPQPAGV